MALVPFCVFPGLAVSQGGATCTTRTTTVALETPSTEQNAFLYESGGYTVEFRPESVIDYWREGRNADPGLAEILSNELPLQNDMKLEIFINDRILNLMAADLMELGHAAIRNQEGRLLQSVELAERGGRPCNFTRAFSDPENGAIILRRTDIAI
jgi:hypothetical protein